MSGERHAASLPGLRQQFAHEPRLADARLASDQHERAVTGEHPIERAFQFRRFSLTSDERRPFGGLC